MVLGSVKSKLHNSKRYIGSNSNNKNEKEVLQLVDDMVPEIKAKVKVKTGTKDLITIKIKDIETAIGPMVVITTIVVVVAIIILDVTMRNTT